MKQMSAWHCCALALAGLTLLSCQEADPAAVAAPQFKVESVEFYEAKLHDPAFVWEGATSREDRIPVLHAARALACIGDPAVPALLRALKDESVDINSIYDALSEIGIPVHEFEAEIYRRETKGVAEWWETYRLSSRWRRSRHRDGIGLPPL